MRQAVTSYRALSNYSYNPTMYYMVYIKGRQHWNWGGVTKQYGRLKIIKTRSKIPRVQYAFYFSEITQQASLKCKEDFKSSWVHSK